MTTLERTWTTYLSYCNDRRLDELGDFVHDELQFNGKTTTLKDYAAAIAASIEAVPDFHWHLEDIVSNDEMVAVRLTDTGTPESEWLGLPSTGRSFTTQELAVYQFRDGKIAEMWFLIDIPAVRSQTQ